MARRQLKPLAMTAAVTSLPARAQTTTYEDIDGIRWQVTKRTVQVPVQQTGSQQQTVYTQQVSTQTVQQQQLYSVPVTQYWSATVYDRSTHTFIRNMPWPGRSSESPELQTNADGSTDIYFGPSPPEGKGANWIPTTPYGDFEVVFRFHGPGQPLFDRTWQLPDIEQVN